MNELDELAKAALQEIREEFELPPRQRGDLTTQDIARDLGVCLATARDVMAKKEAAGIWYSTFVRDHRNIKVKVYRKVKGEDE